MKRLQVDPIAREIVAGPGVLCGEFDKAAQAHQLATTGGQVSHTGIAGLTLGGGLVYLMGKHGAACDNLFSDAVTADGETPTASADQNSDLFWAMRGAGANFGVVTSFHYRLHPLRVCSLACCFIPAIEPVNSSLSIEIFSPTEAEAAPRGRVN